MVQCILLSKKYSNTYIESSQHDFCYRREIKGNIDMEEMVLEPRYYDSKSGILFTKGTQWNVAQGVVISTFLSSVYEWD